MSKHVKDLLTKDLSGRLDDVQDCVLANVIGLDANSTVLLRQRLRQKDISVMVVKNSLAQRATEGTTLSAAFHGIQGPAAIVWGAEDFVSLVKEVVNLDKSAEFEAFQARGGVMDGEQLSADKVKEISNWPSRLEQLSILSGQLTAPYCQLQSQMTGPAGQLASQIAKKAEES